MLPSNDLRLRIVARSVRDEPSRLTVWIDGQQWGPPMKRDHAIEVRWWLIHGGFQDLPDVLSDGGVEHLTVVDEPHGPPIHNRPRQRLLGPDGRWVGPIMFAADLRPVVKWLEDVQKRIDDDAHVSPR